jgi:hypothetical protein
MRCFFQKIWAHRRFASTGLSAPIIFGGTPLSRHTAKNDTASIPLRIGWVKIFRHLRPCRLRCHQIGGGNYLRQSSLFRPDPPRIPPRAPYNGRKPINTPPKANSMESTMGWVILFPQVA